MSGSLVTFNKLSSGNRSAPTSISATTFSLPFPRELSVRTEYGWESTELGIVGGIAFQTSRNMGVTGGGMTEAGQAFLRGLKDKAPQIGLAALDGVLSGASGTSGVEAALGGQGLFLNPKLEVLFKGVKHREFELLFDLAPTTATDSVNLLLFLKKLHVFAAPDLVGDKAFFKYPETTRVVIRGDGVSGGAVTVDRGNCVITGIDCNMTPDGVWASFKDGNPVHVTVAIKFLEMDLPTKENDRSIF